MNVLIVLLCIIIVILFDIANSLRKEYERKINTEKMWRRLWFGMHRDYLQREQCSCSENGGPCMAHYTGYQRWRSGATEAYEIGDEVAARLKD